MNDQIRIAADDHELPAAFDQVKAARGNFAQQPIPPDFPLDIAHGAAHHTTGFRGLGLEYLGKPLLVGLEG